jgi:predicted ABC-type ATPase
MRVFAGPNGSGKSTIINSVKQYEVNGVPIDFGIYINADLILQTLLISPLEFLDFEIEVEKEDFLKTAIESGLVDNSFSEGAFRKTFDISKNQLILLDKGYGDRLAQITADFLRKKLLQLERKFSFETVFSHSSKIDIMKQAAEKGYKVYLYFVSTEDPEINKFRVKEVRVKEGGHDVPEDKIESRYYRSLQLMFDAAQVSYQAYFFDNSKNGEGFRQVAHFKVIKGEKVWDPIDDIETLPFWFIKHYLSRV